MWEPLSRTVTRFNSSREDPEVSHLNGTTSKLVEVVLDKFIKADFTEPNQTSRGALPYVYILTRDYKGTYRRTRQSTLVKIKSVIIIAEQARSQISVA